MSSCFLVFDSIHHVLATEREFQRNEVWCDLVPTPRSIDSNCGMVVEVQAKDLPRVTKLIENLTRKPRGMFQLVDGNYQEISKEQS